MHFRTRTRLLFASALAVLATQAPAAQQAPVSEETLAYFGQNCASCHTIGGGRLTGPDLKGVTERRERAWLVDFMLDPKGVIDSGDPYAVALLKEARGVYMPPAPGLTRAQADKLVDLLIAESSLEKSHFAGLQISDRPLTAADVATGRDLFAGRIRFAGGAPACASCHTTVSMGGFGGGRLGPDLSTAFSRLEGRKSLAAWLSAPPSASMQPVFQGRDLDPEEILALVAYLQADAQTGVLEAEPSSLAFVLTGLITAGALLACFDLLWRNRFRSVRRTLVARR